MNAPAWKDYQETANWLSTLQRPLVFSHAKPDGDALGSLVGMNAMLNTQGIAAKAVLFDKLPPAYAYFSRFDPIPVLGTDIKLKDFDSADGVIVIDTCTYTQLEPIADWLKNCGKPILAIDHHVNRDSLARKYLVDEKAAAACLMLYQLARAAGWSLDTQASEALFIGMATDTGWFRFSNTDNRVLGAAAELAEKGVKPHEVHQGLFQSERPSRVHLLGAALQSLELHLDERLAVMTLTRSDFAKCGADAGDTENIVNEPLRIAGIAASVILVDHGESKIRCSFRSKPPMRPGDPDIDVSAIAGKLGGGGHRRASATRIEKALPDTKKIIIKAFQKALSR
ncbi:MAG: DHH family phosphoesterase [Planctomycetota bacterium]|jgi:phosphoesterase RecJ-like protein